MPSAAAIGSVTSLISTEATYRSSVSPVGVIPIDPHQSGATAGTSTLGEEMINSGLPSRHAFASVNVSGAGMSAGLPRGAPPSTHLAIFAISSAPSDVSSLKCWMPTVLSMYHGGITSGFAPRPVRCLIAFAHGRTSSYVINDMGADRPWAMAALTAPLQNRGDVPREGHRLGLMARLLCGGVHVHGGEG